ncbi:YutD family protein [Lentibacillus saliphilus]|uniref:YutD family protein n=1 Tax=Lentibacillus saliphilus TaxID=2737028 RepID=UPI001C2FB76E|nr:YutD family protein [Lentibacillus saliphilus]
MIEMNGKTYEVIKDVRDGFDEDAFKEKYSDILAKYDYIVGDWGYEQLRLKGFYHDRNQKANYESKISALEDYIYEYCNFGCAHFVLKKIDK